MISDAFVPTVWEDGALLCDAPQVGSTAHQRMPRSAPPHPPSVRSPSERTICLRAYDLRAYDRRLVSPSLPHALPPSHALPRSPSLPLSLSLSLSHALPLSLSLTLSPSLPLSRAQDELDELFLIQSGAINLVRATLDDEEPTIEKRHAGKSLGVVEVLPKSAEDSSEAMILNLRGSVRSARAVGLTLTLQLTRGELRSLMHVHKPLARVVDANRQRWMQAIHPLALRQKHWLLALCPMELLLLIAPLWEPSCLSEGTKLIDEFSDKASCYIVLAGSVQVRNASDPFGVFRCPSDPFGVACSPLVPSDPFGVFRCPSDPFLSPV